MTYQLTREQIAELRIVHRETRDRNFADRIKAVVLLGTGWRPEKVAEALLMDEKTIRHYFHLYEQGGVAALLSTSHRGGISRLSQNQEKELGEYLDEHLIQTSHEVVVYVRKTYGIKYQSSGMKALLKRIGFVYKKPKHVPGKANREEQETYLKKYRELRENMDENDVMLFMDGCHPMHNSVPGYGWIRKGREHELKANTGRSRVNINGTYDVDRHEWSVIFSETVNAQSTLVLFQKIEHKYENAKMIYIVCDNARYYKSRLIQEYLARSRIKMISLPPYSPNLNLIERFWEFFRRKVLNNRYYETFSEFVRSCKNFFRCRKKYKAELRTLMTENFHLFTT